MGTDFIIECKNCGYNIGLTLGIGIYPPIHNFKAILSCLHYTKRREIKQILKIFEDKEHKEIFREYFYKIFQCNKCYHLFSRFWLLLSHNNKKIYETN